MMLGLILLLRDTGTFHYYHRIGLCFWDLSYTTIGGESLSQYAFLHGKSNGWKPLQGCFG
jgi:hypothetical protein